MTEAARRRRRWMTMVLVPMMLGACSGSGSSSGRLSIANDAPRSATGPTPGPATTTTAASSTTGSVATGPLAQRTEPSLPVKVQETAAAATADHLYVIDGYDAAQNSTANVFVFDGRAWTRGPALPIALNHLAAAAIGNTVYVAGGFGASGATNRAFALDTADGRWREIASMNHARGAHVLEAVGGRLYAIGGRVGTVQVGPPEAYDPATKTWSDLPDLPHPRNHLSGYLDGNRICVTGGREPTTSARTDCFDIATAGWTSGPALPTATSGASAAMVAGTVVVASGEPANETSLLTTVAERRGDAWVTVPMLAPRHGTAYALFNGRLWMCGGATAPGVHASSACTSLGAGS